MNLFSRFSTTVVRNLIKMSTSARLDAVPLAEIDEGVFKYILIKVYGRVDENGVEPAKTIVRGFLRAEWHADIYDEVSSSLKPLGLDTECLGGGRIAHDPTAKPQVKIYGYSQGFGKGDHELAKQILLTKYPNYEIECSDEGY